MSAVTIKKLTKRFKKRTAVDGIDLKIREGEFFALLGTNGAGKTTTIKMLSCLLEPTSGDAELMGNSIMKHSHAVKPIINVSPQETAIASKLSVLENLELIARIYGSSALEATRKAHEMLQTFRLTERAKDRAASLSGGMQRRLSIAMALITKPQILFLDEPTLGLDVHARRDLWNTIRELKGKITIILTTHYLEEAESLADRIGIMHRGKMEMVGTAAEITNATGTNNLEEAFLSIEDKEVV
ncbi:ABC transporter ATP-binding protein [Paenibacillus sp. JCM 10914]|uniref:ABC transporter ATP-binding protein n=1 Tax=Paenibacillus sp. JCM 10914 TaxID=1236974 RepID=UPI0003CC9129|nr:ABC transporter ATP-binding protein [Paenibacillus sp. JCM 10914]GAE06867.1 ABC-type multidrug transporter, ATPase component, putative [Paenibacillus sp. JCM 10914]